MVMQMPDKGDRREVAGLCGKAQCGREENAKILSPVCVLYGFLIFNACNFGS